jgi:hypothetical protein
VYKCNETHKPANCGEYRYIQPVEARAEAYLAVVHGAVGILWFTAEAQHNASSQTQYIALQRELPALWKEFSRISLELRRLTPAILSGNATAPTLRCNASGALHARAWDWAAEHATVVVAVNAGAVIVRVRCAVGGAGLAEVLGEGRNMSVVDGVLEDDLAPLATHVYIIRPMLKHDDVHASAPQVSLTWLLAKPGFVDVRDATPPIVFWASYPVLPNETVMLAGGGFERTTIASSQVRVVPLTTPAAAVTVRPSQVTAGTVKVVLPATLPLDAYNVSVDGSAPITVNQPDLWCVVGCGHA